jgi:SAM-dependent methyltransferase
MVAMITTAAPKVASTVRFPDIYSPLARRHLLDAGITPGMRVLNLAAGVGDAALVAADLVGPEGSVVGIDPNQDAVAEARRRAQACDLSNVSFIQGGSHAAELEGPFDAAIGRFHLMYAPVPSAVLRTAARLVRPGGVIAFQEHNLTRNSVLAYPASPLASRIWRWMLAVARRSGIEMRMGYKLRAAYLAAGLPAPQVRSEALIGGGPDWDGYAYVENALRCMLPTIAGLGLATPEEVGIDSLAERLRAETLARGGVIKLPDLVSAWTRIV